MTRHTARHLLATTAAAALVALVTASPASARLDAGQGVAASTGAASSRAASTCSLERVGSQLVRCDSLTGNGVTAPGWMRSATASTAVNAGVSSALVAEAKVSATREQDALTKFRRHGI